ncbi:hypothetical protein G4H71_03080 [Rhodococcus triatomae]|uniref:Proteins of 100 residues with WXG n=1 Tax=Rhodococcus triatomae TaxID=300028 RepID=A0A1G8M6T5_9NOCA|nr:hypothetical protein [Rhodococcus triatomae]QNG18177.1 hypothetical protein G4H72_04965 [Rhodococcus triatomae]QNG22153.1 hypothetical protein G4H71_03080 [Rhodococcus triatomae]SDI63662.1 hypothetical protein SAMN05444695_109126 [Rhodococcus triatomae]
MTDSLIAEYQPTSTGLTTGLTLFEAAWQVSDGIEAGDLGSAASGRLGVAVDTASAVIDPIGYVASQTISWMLEHIEPAREALDNLAGNPAMVASYAQSWSNIENELTSVRESMGSEVKSGTSDWSGQAAEAYRARADDIANIAGAAAAAANGLATATEGMSKIVAGVRTAVRDLLASIAASLLSWTAQILASVGFAAPAVVAQAVTRIAQVVRTVGNLLGDLAKYVQLGLEAIAMIRSLLDGCYNALQVTTAQ